MTMPYPVPIATMTPNVTAAVPSEIGVTNVAAYAAINKAPNQPNRNPTPETTPTVASSATHHQS
jgi:hypothetical protein